MSYGDLCFSDVAIAGSGEEPSSAREARSAGPQVAVQPVDCVQSEWSSWTRCDVCRKKRVNIGRRRKKWMMMMRRRRMVDKTC